MSSPHRIVNPPGLMPPVGFGHAVVAAPGRTVYLGGQTGHDRDGRLVGESLVLQFDRAAANVVEALGEVGGAPTDVVSMQILVVDLAEYRAASAAIGDAYRKHFGSHFPAMALFEVAGLYDSSARVELVCVAVVAA